MSRGKKTKTKKHDLLREICKQLDIPPKSEYFARGSTIQANALEDILFRMGKENGVPPEHIEDHEKYTWKLLHKSISGMILGIEIINKPSISYRMESFLFLLTNAWELLLKAKIITDEASIDSIKTDDNSERTISFSNALKTVFPNENNVVRQNLFAIEKLRNVATHNFIPIVPPRALLMFQAAILNYEKYITDWFSWSLCDYIPKGMIFLVSEIDPSQFTSDSPLLKKYLTPDAIDVLSNWESEVSGIFSNLPDDQIASFAIPINLNVLVTNNPTKADIQAQWGGSGLGIKKQRPIDAYPLTYTDLYKKVHSKCPVKNRNDINLIIKEHNIKDNPEFSVYNYSSSKREKQHKDTGELPSITPSIYNAKAVEFIVAKLNGKEGIEQ